MNKQTLGQKRFVKPILSFMAAVIIGSTITAFDDSSTASAATPQSEELISTSKELMGIPYRFGAPSGVTYAFDCSSFTQFVFKQSDVKLPRTTGAQAKVGEKVAKGLLSQGDLVFFKTNGRSISHVGIYVGDNKMIHTSSSKGVILTDINSKYWKSKYVTARRVLS